MWESMRSATTLTLKVLKPVWMRRSTACETSSASLKKTPTISYKRCNSSSNRTIRSSRTSSRPLTRLSTTSLSLRLAAVATWLPMIQTQWLRGVRYQRQVQARRSAGSRHCPGFLLSVLSKLIILSGPSCLNSRNSTCKIPWSWLASISEWLQTSTRST